MSTFTRQLSDVCINKLQKEPLFTDCLLDDIQKGNVFPAIRKNRVDFYYRGGKLFSYSEPDLFVTHIKYASILFGNKYYINEKSLPNIPMASSFYDAYSKIKKLCSLYAGKESRGVSQILRQFSNIIPNNTSKCTTSLIIPLDIEVCLTKNYTTCNEDEAIKENERIDIVFFDMGCKKCLRFCEVKHYSNKDIRAKHGNKPVVINQIQGYHKEIIEHHNDILSAYKEYIDRLNLLFNCSIPRPESIDDNIILLVFGFDEDQKNGRLNQLLSPDGSLKDTICYPIGHIRQINFDGMWRCKKGQ